MSAHRHPVHAAIRSRLSALPDGVLETVEHHNIRGCLTVSAIDGERYLGIHLDPAVAELLVHARADLETLLAENAALRRHLDEKTRTPAPSGVAGSEDAAHLRDMSLSSTTASATTIVEPSLFGPEPQGVPSPVELLATALLDAEDSDDRDDEPIDQPFLPGLLRTCMVCGEFEGAGYVNYGCVFVQDDSAVAA